MAKIQVEYEFNTPASNDEVKDARDDNAIAYIAEQLKQGKTYGKLSYNDLLDGEYTGWFSILYITD